MAGLSSTSRKQFPLTSKRLLSWRWIGALCGITALLVAIGALQYRWNTQIRQAMEVRMGADLESAMMKWHLDLYGEFSAICIALQIGPDSGARDSWDDYLHRYGEWIRAASDPQSVENLYTNRDLIKDVYIWETSTQPSVRLLRFNAEDGKIESSAIPADLFPLLTHLQRNSSSLRSALRAWRSETAGEDVETIGRAGAQSAQRLRSTAITGWQFDEQIPAVVHPILSHAHSRPARSNDHNSSDPVDWVVVVLNLDTVQHRILPGLTQRYFSGSGGLEYKVAVVTAGKSSRLLYSSDRKFGLGDVSGPDSIMNLFGPPPESIEGDYWQTVKNSRSVKGEEWRSFSGPVWFPIIQATSESGPWMLILHTGPLEETITKVWRSNLITGGVVLLLLATSMVLVVVASQQAQALANLQMDFVTSVSHELRTPLAAIHSAGQNMIDGYVPDLAIYGNLITSQSRQLIDLVDQVLLFASVKAGKLQYLLGPVQVADVFEEVRKNIGAVSQQAGYTIEFRAPEAVPSVMGDRKALARCLQNLIGNAMKYSGKSRWIGVDTEFDRSVAADKEVRINVRDRGVGISPGELQQIFKPYYRSPDVIPAQIHGTGLGLSVAKHIIESMGGKISVISELGKGSVFTLHLLVADPSKRSNVGETVEALTSR